MNSPTALADYRGIMTFDSEILLIEIVFGVFIITYKCNRILPQPEAFNLNSPISSCTGIFNKKNSLEMFNRMKSDDYVRNFVLSRINHYKKSQLLVERDFYD